MTTLRVAVLDAGAVRNIGWAALDVEAEPDVGGTWSAGPISRVPRGGSSRPADRGSTLESLVSCVADALEREIPVALGVEAPCFVPVRRDEAVLLDQRCGEDGMAFSNQIGALVTVQGAVEIAWVLSELARWGRSATVDPELWPTRHPLLLWEAFVARDGKGGADSRALPDRWRSPADGEHIGDAATAVMAFVRRGRPAVRDSDVDTCGEPAFNIVAAAAVRAGLSTEPVELSRRCYVVRAR